MVNILIYHHPLLTVVNKPTHTVSSFQLILGSLEYDKYRRLRLQFFVLLMMGAVTPETCRVNKERPTLCHLFYYFII